MNKDYIENKIVDRENIPELGEKKNILGKWSEFFVNRYRVVYLIILMIGILGITSYFGLPRELQPEIILPYGNIFTVYNGAAPEEVESQITNKIEKAVSDIEDIKEVTSYSGLGYSQVFVEFEQGVDIDEKIGKINEKVSAVNDLPEGAEDPNVSAFETNNGPILILNITGDMDFKDLKIIADNISDRLENESSIKEALVIGGLEREISIIVDPLLIYNYNISLDDIKNAISQSNINFPGGTITLDKKNYNLRTIGEFSDVSQIEDVVIKYDGNKAISIKDIAKVVDGNKEIVSYSRISQNLGKDNAGVTPSISIAVKKKKSADIIKTSNLINKIVTEGRGKIYPEDLYLYISGDTANYVRDQLGGVTENALSGLFIVLIVLFLFIGFGEAVVVSMVIPLAIMIALWLLKCFDMTLNTITLFSLVLAVGMLVDNGIVIMENIDRLRFNGLTAKEAAIVGTNQIAPAVFSSMLTTVAAFFPIALTTGIMGAFIKPIPITVIFAIASSFLIAITITPALCSIILKRHRSEKITEKPIFIKLKRIFSVLFIFVLSIFAFRNDGNIGLLSIVFAIIFSTMMIIKQFSKNTRVENIGFIKRYSEILYSIISSKRKRILAVLGTFIAFILSMSLLFTGVINISMFPNEDQERLYVDVSTPNGTTIDKTDEIVKEIEKRLLGITEIESFVSNVGITGADSFEGFGEGSSGNPEIGRIIIDLVKAKERNITSIDLAENIRQLLKGIPGGEIKVLELESGPPQDNPVVINIKGENLNLLKSTAKEFEKILENIEGTREINSSVSNGDMELQIKVDKTKAVEMGVSDISVAMAIRNSVEGLKATTYRSNQDEIDVVIKTTENSLKSKEDLNNIYVFNRRGQPVKLSSIANIKEVEGLVAVVHEDSKRRITVSSKLENGYNASLVTKEFQELIGDNYLNSGLTIDYGGEMESLEESFSEMFRNMIIAAVLVYIILSVQFNSLSQPIIILFTLPMALIGVMPGLLLTGNDFGFVTFVGIVSLIGIAVNDAIVLVDYINYLRKNGYELYDAVKETGISRFIPVMATTITTTGGILPLSMKEKFFQPLGVALICGLCTATILTLIIIPSLYTIMEERKIRKANKRFAKKNGGLLDEKENEAIINY